MKNTPKRRKGSAAAARTPPLPKGARLHETGRRRPGKTKPSGNSFQAALRAFSESGQRARRFALVDDLLARGAF